MLIVKIGGGRDLNIDGICEDFASLKNEALIVHGGNSALKELTEGLGKEVKKIISPSGFESRYSDSETMELFTMAYCGLMNKKIVSKLQALGVNAVGLSGIDGHLWQGARKKAIVSVKDGVETFIKDNFFIKVTDINVLLLNILLSNGFVPVLTAPGISYEGEICNLDNDRAIAVMVKDMKADTLIYLLEAPGILANYEDDSSLISKLAQHELDELIVRFSSGMKRKLLGIKEAFDAGVKRVYVSDGRVAKPISAALNGAGTLIE